MPQKQCYETKYFWTLQGNGFNSKKSNEELKRFFSLWFGNPHRRPEDFRCTWEGWHTWPLPKTFLDLHNSSYDSQLYSTTVNYVLVKSRLQHHPWAFDIFAVPGGEGGEPQPWFHVTCLGDSHKASGLWNDFREENCGFVAKWLQSKGLHKLCAMF